MDPNQPFAQMFEQMQQQQAMLAAAMLPNNSNAEGGGGGGLINNNRIVINANNLNGLPLPILQMAGGDSDQGDEGGEEDEEGGDENCSSCQPGDVNYDNLLINSYDCGDYDQEAAGGCNHGNGEDYLTWYCCDSEMQMNLDACDCQNACADYLEEDDEECLTLAASTSIDCCVGEVEEEVIEIEDSSSSSSEDGCCDHACGEGTTIVTMKEGAPDEGIEKAVIATQTGPTSEEKGVQAIEMKNTAVETEPLKEEPMEDVFDRVLAQVGGPQPERSTRRPQSPGQIGGVIEPQRLPRRQGSTPQFNDPYQPKQQGSFTKSKTFSSFSTNQPDGKPRGVEPSPSPQQWRTSKILSHVQFKEDAPHVREIETPPAAVPVEEAREPIILKFNLGLRIDSVRDLPHLLAAPHSNTEHYCAYCTPDSEALIRPPLLMKARLTVYDRSTGHLSYCGEGAVNSETNWALTNVRHNRYVFGRQSAVFPKSVVTQDSILVVRLYARQKKDFLHIDPSYALLIKQSQLEQDGEEEEEERHGDDDDLIGWAVMHIFDAFDEGKDGEEWQLKSGLQLIPVYCPPVPMIIQIPHPNAFTDQWKKFRRLGAHSSVAVWVGHGAFTNLDDSSEDEDPEDDEEVRRIDKKLWVDGGAQPRITEPFTSADGFDLYVDGARGLPDFVTATKVVVRIAQANHAKAASDELCYSQLDSDIFNPFYNYRVEYRKLAREIVPRSTITFKIYTIDRFTHKLAIVGYAYLNLFNNLGVVGQPLVDEGIQVTLNEGSFQMRIYATPPDLTHPLSVQLPIADKHRPWPCATLLARIVKAPKDDFGNILSTTNVPESKWIETGLVRPKPNNYSTGTYLSKACKPTIGERQLFATYRRRLPFEVRKAVVEIGQLVADRTIPIDNDQLLQSVLERLLSRFGVDTGTVAIPHGNLNFAAAYDPIYGYAISIDKATGLPWAGATFGHLVANPPAAFYIGPPYSRFDTPKFLARLDLNSSPSNPRWLDGFIKFTYRSGQRMQSTGLRVTAVVIVHLQEVTIRRTYLNFEYGLSGQAWTVVPLFVGHTSPSHPYIANEKLVLPLFSGSPSIALLKEMSTVTHLTNWLDNCIHVKKIHPVSGARLHVRVCDARRTEEFSISDDYMPVNHSFTTITSIVEAEPPSLVPFLPPALTSIPMRSYLCALVANDEKFFNKIISSLPDKYRQMVFKLYYANRHK